MASQNCGVLHTTCSCTQLYANCVTPGLSFCRSKLGRSLGCSQLGSREEAEGPYTYPAEGSDQGQQSSCDAVLIQGSTVLWAEPKPVGTPSPPTLPTSRYPCGHHLPPWSPEATGFNYPRLEESSRRTLPTSPSLPTEPNPIPWAQRSPSVALSTPPEDHRKSQGTPAHPHMPQHCRTGPKLTSPAGSSSSCGRQSQTADGPELPGSVAHEHAAPGLGSGGQHAPSEP